MWIDTQLERLSALVHQPGADPSIPLPEALVATRHFVHDLGARPGITGAFAALDGLVVEVSEHDQPFEEAAAVAQRVLEHLTDTSALLGLGGFQHTVVVGTEGKLVLFQVGMITLGIMGSREESLAEALA